MGLSRRRFAAGIAGAALGARAQSRPAQGLPARLTPPVCLYSRILAKVDYNDLGLVLRNLGFDGCDLSVQRGGHVPPEKAPTELMPTLEAVTGAGLDVFVLTTDFISGTDMTARNTLFLAGLEKVSLFRAGAFKFAGALESPARGAQLQRDIAQLAGVGRAYGLVMAIQNSAEGAAISDIDPLIRPFDTRWVGYDFDIGYATAQGAAGESLRIALPRLKMVTVRDFKWTQGKTTAPCLLGEGVVEWGVFFGVLARAKFTGPISVQVDHQPTNELPAIRKDLEFVRKQIAAAYR